MKSNQSFSVPILLLGFNRPSFLQQQMLRLSSIQPPKLYLSLDGPRSEQEVKLIEDCERVVKTGLTWKCKLQIHRQPTNLGLRNAVISGINWFFLHEIEGVIIEDDVIPNPSFFWYASELLDKYRDDSDVLLISGDNFFPEIEIENSYTAISHTPIWGWATWKDRWNRAEEFMKQYSAIEILTNKDMFSRQQRDQIADNLKRQHSWALDLLVYQKMMSLLSIVPQHHLITNTGVSGNSSHTKYKLFQFFIPSIELTFPLKHPKKLTLHKELSEQHNKLHSRLFLLFHTIRWYIKSYIFGHRHA